MLSTNVFCKQNSIDMMDSIFYNYLTKEKIFKATLKGLTFFVKVRRIIFKK